MDFSTPQLYIEVAYLLAAVTFIISLRRLSNPKTARSGNQVAAVGMTVAVLATFASIAINGLDWHIILIIVGAAIGGGIGWVLARRVEMTAMPQMVALFNGMGGGAAALTSISEFVEKLNLHLSYSFDFSIATVLGVVIGCLSLSGSFIALGKLQGFISSGPVTYAGQQIVNIIVGIVIVVLGIYMVAVPAGDFHFIALLLMALLALVLGVAITMPIGGADMPVVISLLNSFTGLAAAFTGFVLRSNVLVIAGALVGASGMLLTQLMGKAMNRPLTNVLFGAFGQGGGSDVAATGAGARPIRELSADDVATLLAYANQVVIVPGYGMAVARAQNAVQDLAKQLEARGVTVKYGIHPVAGRMPGHMNVLLAEADVPYNQLAEMDEINPEMPRTDVVLVIGANDVVNPAARNDPKSPIYGMPIIDVDKAQNVIVMKRSMRSGFAGIDNDLFYEPKTAMLFGDAKETAQALAAAVKNL
ncbi:MAG: NAD(P)(+) transhydrogenase (Re/Si-specific) subunit beta, partial [Chloroflexia bacterium]